MLPPTWAWTGAAPRTSAARSESRVRARMTPPSRRGAQAKPQPLEFALSYYSRPEKAISPGRLRSTAPPLAAQRLEVGDLVLQTDLPHLHLPGLAVDPAEE